MKMYFTSRQKARIVAAGKNTVKDMKDNPSMNGSRWAIEMKRKIVNNATMCRER